MSKYFLRYLPVENEERFVHPTRRDGRSTYSSVTTRHRQIIAHICLQRDFSHPQTPSHNIFPVVIDTGFNGFLAINTDQLKRWADLSRTELKPQIGIETINGHNARIVAGRAWIYRNKRGQSEPDRTLPPRLLYATNGIHIFDGDAYPRIPLLGIQALESPALVLKIDGKRQQVSLYKPFW